MSPVMICWQWTHLSGFASCLAVLTTFSLRVLSLTSPLEFDACAEQRGLQVWSDRCRVAPDDYLLHSGHYTFINTAQGHNTFCSNQTMLFTSGSLWAFIYFKTFQATSFTSYICNVKCRTSNKWPCLCPYELLFSYNESITPASIFFFFFHHTSLLTSLWILSSHLLALSPSCM